MMRLAMDGEGRALVEALGGRRKDGGSMPRFSRFMLKRAKGVEAVVLYRDKATDASQLSRMGFDLMSSRELRRAHVAEIGRE